MSLPSAARISKSNRMKISLYILEKFKNFITMSWSNVDTPHLIPTPFFNDKNNKNVGVIVRKKHLLFDR